MITKLLSILLGHQTAYRLGRALYREARGDVANNMMTNGELMVQRCVVSAWRRSSAQREGIIVFDVGANVGDWSAAFLANFDGSNDARLVSLYMFEPAPDTAHVLKERIGKLQGDLHFESLALSSSEGLDQIYITGKNAGTNTLHRSEIFAAELSMQIKKTTASRFCLDNGIDKIHLFKSDAEGHDMEIIRGALPLLIEGRIYVLQFEYNHSWVLSRSYLKDVFDTVKGLPYKLAKIQPNCLKVYDSWHPELERDFEGNYVLIRNDVVCWFRSYNVSIDRYNTYRTISAYDESC